MLNDLSLADGVLVWCPQRGIGFFPVVDDEKPYDIDYFLRYQQLDATIIGAQLTHARMNFVSNYYSGNIIDIGIGGGRFCTERPNTFGYDINPHAIEWLKRNGKFLNPNDSCYAPNVRAATFWDSLEHIKNPTSILSCFDFVFVSMPIYENCTDVLNSKHFRPDEHFWYFTEHGFMFFMKKFGFQVIGVDDFETRLGRDSILTFACKRVK